jgi:transposase
VRWISRVPETSAEAKAAVRTADAAAWQRAGELSFTPVATAPGGERWVVGRTSQGEERARATLARKAEQAQGEWEKTLWHLSVQRFACAPDAQAALAKQLSRLPEWRQVEAHLVAHPTHTRPGRPRKDSVPACMRWQVAARVTVDAAALERAVVRQACVLVATNVLDPTVLSEQELIQT